MINDAITAVSEIPAGLDVIAVVHGYAVIEDND
jgi:hypothetical protein